jgi:hypothetical protein
MDEDTQELFVLQEELDSDALFNGILEELLSSSDEEADRNRSRVGRAPNKNRDFVAAYTQLVKDYFSGSTSTYNEADFERRFRMPRALFNKINETLMGIHPFVQYHDCIGKIGIHPLVKMVACLRFLAYGDAYDREDENLRLSQSSLRDLVRSFCKLVIVHFGPLYLNRCPTSQERSSISNVMARKGFPGCLASWDCKFFGWKNCPMRLSGQYSGHKGKGLILEAIADHRRYFWYINFGDPGSLNDINVLDKSSIVGALLSGRLSLRTDTYTINGNDRDWMYFLVDGIYPDWAIFVKTYTEGSDERKKNFAIAQERVRKDIEAAFGILVQRFHIIQRPMRGWYLEDLTEIVQCCACLHNMIVVDRFGPLTGNVDIDIVEASSNKFPLFGKNPINAQEAANDGVDLFAARVAAFDQRMRSSYEHFLLKKDLVEHTNSE